MAHSHPNHPESLRIIFAGTPEFAVVALAKLLDSPHEICAVYTQPDRPAGRGRKLKPGPVKALATQHDIPVQQPTTLKEETALTTLANWQADIMVVVAYGLLLPPKVLALPRLGCINIHASLLPRWRGAAPIQRAILAGDKESGITLMQMDAGLDTGAMLLQKKCPIGPDDTAETLHDRLSHLGAAALIETLQGLQAGTLQGVAQDDAQASYAKKLDKKEARLDWGQNAQTLSRQVRAFNPWPVATTTLIDKSQRDKTLRIWQAQPLAKTVDAPPGTIMQCGKQGIDVACGEGVLRLLKIQLAGGKALKISEFLNGHPDLLTPGMCLAN